MLRIGVSNPTSLSNHAKSFAKLPCDICMLSESSATAAMQPVHSRAYRKLGLHITWGAGVPSQRMCSNGAGSVRGSALGVCILSKRNVAVRPSRGGLPDHWFNTGRIMIAYAQLSSFTVRLISVYGFQHCAPGACSKNQILWHAVLGLLQSSNMPTVIGGDFNCRPQSKSVWPAITALGYAEVFEQFQNTFAFELPATCHSSTRHDTLVYSRHFVLPVLIKVIFYQRMTH